jgi:hypothetical protein
VVRGFAELPARIAALAREHERLAVVLLDAFGWAFVQRHADHPLLRRLEIEPVASQFPSTTTAHLTTLYSGLPVGEHGLYEWRVYEPELDEIVLPLPFVTSHKAPLPLEPRDVFPWPAFFAGATVLQPAPIAGGRYGSAAFAGARVLAFETIEAGVAQLGGPGLTYLYWDAIDFAGHRHGPSSPEFDAAIRQALDALAAYDGPLLVTADHGQIDVDPERLDELDVIWPELLDRLKRDRMGRPLWPAGSARDCFLHVEEPDEVVDQLSRRLGGRAEVRLAPELFPDAGPRLRARLGDVCVLPAPGRMAWLRAFPSHERRFRGHHGGLTAAESETWVGTTLP